ncbi:exopolysaccharide Pel transporter PelG [Paenibacillus dakarensis]|uniref:exopolysaccharide Pel transporter PelG n=1 Tax=Paenibacillus dakarensis TaxID=1527293 RepID=UPI0006D5B790|nr:exopolysaccharide Pel transporter PelG [Paenibacillus dakarensis]
MAGIGFELRKLFREQGLINHVKAYTFSTLTTIGPMLLCIFLIIVLQRFMIASNGTYQDWELYISTMQYAFIFSIIITGGISMVLTRFIADMIFEKKYEHLLSSFYGALIICLPLTALAAWLFLQGVSAGIGYKVASYLFFMELVVVWLQSVYLSALKDYTRIVRSFLIGIVISLLTGFILLTFTSMNATTAAVFSIDIGFLIIILMSFYHFEQVFPAKQPKQLFAFTSYFKKYPSLFFIGTFMYSGIYMHSFVYWLGEKGVWVAERYAVSFYYDLPVFYAFLSVVPSLVTFVVSVETSFYVKFRNYYKYVIEGGTWIEIDRARKEMQQTLVQSVSFLMQVQLLFTVVSLAIGMKILPKIGFTMAQLDVFTILVLGYFLFIMMFILLHLLLYFDDRRGVLVLSSAFILMNLGFTLWSMKTGSDGLGMLIASLLGLIGGIMRLLHVLRNLDYYTFCSQPLHQAKNKTAAPSKWIGKSFSIIGMLLLSGMVLSACTDATGKEAETKPELKTSSAPASESETHKLSEDKRIYSKDEDDSVKTLYITVLPDKSGKTPELNWYNLNRNTDRYSEENLKVIMQEGKPDGRGPSEGMFGYGASEANAKISLRGNTARYTSQKSYKLRLYDEAGLWLNQRTINLNKHSLDLSRVRNKLSFDLLETLPNITSLRTQFVHVYVKDLSEGGSDSVFKDYGLYTQVEQPNEKFLKSHWLDPYGHLYKVAFFEFNRYPDQIKSQSDPAYDKKKFETILEIKGREDHDKLIQMLDDVNDMSMSIDEVMEKHFDLDNYLTWLAFNILSDNMDTDANNFYLYSPLNSNKWYFLPWDYDGGWGSQRNNRSISDYQQGLSNYWGGILHNRYFRSEQHVNQLKDKIEELSKVINEETVAKQLQIYQKQVETFSFRSPDLDFLPGLKSEIANEFEEITKIPELGKKLFLEDLEKPKPFYLGDVDQDNGSLYFVWENAFDLQGDDLLYDLTVSRDPGFTQIVAEKKSISTTQFTMKELPEGTYYWKVTVRDSKGNSQIAFDSIIYDEEGTFFYGLREFEVE